MDAQRQDDRIRWNTRPHKNLALFARLGGDVDAACSWRAIHARACKHGDRVCLLKRIFLREKMSDVRESVRGEDERNQRDGNKRAA